MNTGTWGHRRAHDAQGFTLIEVLVALAIVAITLATAWQASAAMTQLAQRQSRQWLAQLCAENRLVQLRLQGQWPALGSEQQHCRQGELDFVLTSVVRNTPNPHFRRIDTQVGDGQTAVLLRLSSLVARY